MVGHVAASVPTPGGMLVEAGGYVWLSHESEMWRPCKVKRGTSTKTETATVVDTETGEEFQTPTTMVTHMHPSSLKPVDDMVPPLPWARRGHRLLCSLSRAALGRRSTRGLLGTRQVLLGGLNEAAILHNLRVRYEKLEQIYTFIGPILISVNPFKHLGIYNERVIDRYIRKAVSGQLSSEQPHIFGTRPQPCTHCTDPRAPTALVGCSDPLWLLIHFIWVSTVDLQHGTWLAGWLEV
jgi:hypothetical protein